MKNKNISKSLYWIALTVGAIFLFKYWVQFFILVSDNDPWGHKNYWGGDVGTYLILGVLLAATPIYIIYAWRYRPRKKNKN